MKKLFSMLGSLITFTRKDTSARDGFAPYGEKVTDRAYNLAFCDKPWLFKEEHPEPEGVWGTLLAPEPYAAGLRAIADDRSQPSRIRLLAYRLLREIQSPITRQDLLGVVVEVRSTLGLETLVVYSDGSVQWIAPDAKVMSFDAKPEWSAAVRRLLDAAQRAVDRIGPWLQPRAAPPTDGMVRMSFLVSDGLYFGQGLIDVMNKDPLASPITSASDELRGLIKAATESKS